MLKIYFGFNIVQNVEILSEGVPFALAYYIGLLGMDIIFGKNL